MGSSVNLYFRNPTFPDQEWTEVLSWFDASEEPITQKDREDWPYLRKSWFIGWEGCGSFGSLREAHPRLRFGDEQAHWQVHVETAGGGLPELLVFTLCYCTLTLISDTSVGDWGYHWDHFFGTLCQEPEQFLKKANKIINTNSVYSNNYELKLRAQKMGVLNEKFRLIPDPAVFKRAAQSNLYDE